MKPTTPKSKPKSQTSKRKGSVGKKGVVYERTYSDNELESKKIQNKHKLDMKQERNANRQSKRAARSENFKAWREGSTKRAKYRAASRSAAYGSAAAADMYGNSQNQQQVVTVENTNINGPGPTDVVPNPDQATVTEDPSQLIDMAPEGTLSTNPDVATEPEAKTEEKPKQRKPHQFDFSP